jgi:hypothetical protein
VRRQVAELKESPSMSKKSKQMSRGSFGGTNVVSRNEVHRRRARL